MVAVSFSDLLAMGNRTVVYRLDNSVHMRLIDFFSFVIKRLFVICFYYI